VLTVALARCLEVGEEPPVARREKKRATFSQNHLFDAIAPRWSRTFKKVAEVGNPGCVPTPNIVNFGHGDALEVRRQLLAVGVRLKDTWDIIAGTWSKSDRSKTPGTNPFFYLTRPNAKLGYRVNLRDTEACAELRRLLPPAAIDRGSCCSTLTRGRREGSTTRSVLSARSTWSRETRRSPPCWRRWSAPGCASTPSSSSPTTIGGADR